MLEALIAKAWEYAECPGEKHVAKVHDGIDSCDADAFSGRTWQELDIDFIRQRFSALYVFTVGAWRYYAPAFMLAAVKANDPYEHFLTAFISDFEFRSPHSAERLKALSGPQRDAFLAWLKWLKAEGGDWDEDIRNAAIKSVEDQWWEMAT